MTLRVPPARRQEFKGPAGRLHGLGLADRRGYQPGVQRVSVRPRRGPLLVGPRRAGPLAGDATKSTAMDGREYEARHPRGGQQGEQARPVVLLHLPYSRDGACEHAATVPLYAMDHYGEMAGLASRGALTTAKLVRQADAKYVQRFLARELVGNAELAGGSRAASGCRRRPGLTAASGEGEVWRRYRDRGILARLLRRQLRRAR